MKTYIFKQVNECTFNLVERTSIDGNRSNDIEKLVVEADTFGEILEFLTSDILNIRIEFDETLKERMF